MKFCRQTNNGIGLFDNCFTQLRARQEEGTNIHIHILYVFVYLYIDPIIWGKGVKLYTYVHSSGLSRKYVGVYSIREG